MTSDTCTSAMDRLVTRHRVSFTTGGKGRKQLQLGSHGKAGVLSPPLPKGKVPRIARLMALAIQFESLVQHGVVSDYAELARLGHVTRARILQIMTLRFLAPDIQEAVLSLPRTLRGRDPIRERMVRPITSEPDWRRQRVMWRALLSRTVMRG